MQDYTDSPTGSMEIVGEVNLMKVTAERKAKLISQCEKMLAKLRWLKEEAKTNKHICVCPPCLERDIQTAEKRLTYLHNLPLQ